MISHINAARYCLIFINPDDLQTSPAFFNRPGAIRDTLAFLATCQRIQIIPILLKGAELPEKQSRLPSFLRGRVWVHFQNESDAHALETLAENFLQHQTNRQVSPETDICPFRGLAAFREQDRAWFFGREALLQRMLVQLQANRFMAVLGPSGTMNATTPVLDPD